VKSKKTEENQSSNTDRACKASRRIVLFPIATGVTIQYARRWQTLTATHSTKKGKSSDRNTSCEVVRSYENPKVLHRVRLRIRTRDLAQEALTCGNCTSFSSKRVHLPTSGGRLTNVGLMEMSTQILFS